MRSDHSSLLSPGEAHLECWIHIRAPQQRTDVHAEVSLRKMSMKIPQGQKHLTHRRRMRKLILEKRRLSADLNNVFQFLLGRNKEERDRLFFVMLNARSTNLNTGNSV